MKKYRVTDEDGNALTVEEFETSSADEEPEILDEDPVLTSEEILALKGLAAVAEKLMGLIKTTDEEEISEEEEEEDETISDEEEEEEEEEIIDTDEDTVEEEIVKKTSHDSKKGFGSIEKKTVTKDSALDHELEVAQAWAKRYGGN